MTGMGRSSILTFLLSALLGHSLASIPDDDTLLQAALAVNRFSTSLKDFNNNETAAARTEMKIICLQDKAFQIVSHLSAALNLRINTNLHRLMRHGEIV